MGYDAVAWFKATPADELRVFRHWLIALRSFPLYHNMLKCAKLQLDEYKLNPEPGFDKLTFQSPISGERESIDRLFRGRLAIKNEPAGKIRVFAIADAWTQAALKPLHQYLFRILRDIPNDGTFDQEACLERVALSATRSWSFDLSAATDRLPIFIQAQLLNYVMPFIRRESKVSFGELWASVLTERPWALPRQRSTGKKDCSFSTINYTTGQPMGAYSSWAMLAHTHHFLVQYCYWKEGGTDWFDSYAIVGDDICISNNAAVAARYLEVMRSLGVGISLAKSLRSRTGVIEFIKQLVWKSHNLSGLPLNMIISGVSLQSRLAMTHFFKKRGIVTTVTDAIRVLGIGRREQSSLQNLGWRTQSRRFLQLMQAARIHTENLAGSIKGLLSRPLSWPSEALEHLYRNEPLKVPVRKLDPMVMRIEGMLKARIVDALQPILKAEPWFRGKAQARGGYFPYEIQMLYMTSELNSYLNAITPKEWAKLSYEQLQSDVRPYLSGILDLIKDAP